MAFFNDGGFGGRNRGGRRFDDRNNGQRDNRDNNQNQHRRAPLGSGGIVPKWNRRYFRELTAMSGTSLLNDAARIGKKNDRPNDNRNQQRRYNDDRSQENRPKRRWEDPAAETPVQEKKPQEKHTKMREVLDSFVAEYGSHLNDGAYLKQLMVESFSDVLRILRKYGDDRYNDLNESMDRVFNLMCTDQLSALLLSLIQDNAFENTWDDDWKNLAFVITIILANYGSRINDTSAKARYINEIIPSSAMWKPEIDRMVRDFRITRDMAIDMVLKVPVLAEDMKLWDLNQFVWGFESVIFDHAQENAAVLDAAQQGELFDFTFGKGNHIPPKAISRLLAAPPIEDGNTSEESMAVKAAFREMLYTKLNALDINEIERTLDYIIRERKKIEASGHNIEVTLYNASDASQFDQVAKAINNMIEKDPTNKQYLV